MAAEMIVEISKTFPGRMTIEVQLTLSLEPPSVLIVFGPSGSGKTTLLRCLAGLEWPEQGRIRFGAQTWLETAAGTRMSPQERRLGYMSQDYALFPTHSVAGNIEFGLSELSAHERQRRVADAMELLQLRGLERARPAQLSGGQQQRVALARAIARRPRLLLLDEPLSALDVPTRSRLCGELRLLLKQLALPCVVVTHDWAEALTLGDQVAVMNEGRVLQVGTPKDVFSRPCDAQVARIVGVETVVQGLIVSTREGLATVQVNGINVVALGSEDVGPEVFVCIRAEDVVLEKVGSATTSARNHLAGNVREINLVGALAWVGIDCGFPLRATVTRSALEELHLAPGAPLVAAIKAGAVHLVARREMG